MATDIFLTIAGIEGGSTDASHENAIDLLGWHWGLGHEEPADKDTQRRRRRSRVNVEELLITKSIDKASTPLLKACALGTELPTAILILRSSGSNPVEFLKIEFEDVRVSSIENGGDSSEDRMTENVTFEFNKFKQIYTMANADGSGAAEPEFEFDIGKNV